MSLQVADQLNHVRSGRGRQKNMHVIVGTTNRQNVEAAMARDSAKISPQRLRLADELGSPFGGENAMQIIQNVGSRRQDAAASRLIRQFGLLTAGLRPRLKQMSPVPGLPAVTAVTHACAIRKRRRRSLCDHEPPSPKLVRSGSGVAKACAITNRPRRSLCDYEPVSPKLVRSGSARRENLVCRLAEPAGRHLF